MPKGIAKNPLEKSRKIKENHTHYWLGRKQTEEANRKRSESMKGHEVLKGTRVKISQAKRGHTVLEKTRQKIRVKALKQFENGMPESTRRKISGTFKRKGMKPPKFNELSLEKQEEIRKKEREIKVNNPNRVFKDTGIELKMEAELKRRSISYQKQVPLCKIAIVDFYLPEYKILIQCDGCYYHGCPIHHPKYHQAQKERDKEQDKVLTLNGFRVYRFWEHKINEGVSECIDEIELVKVEK